MSVPARLRSVLCLTLFVVAAGSGLAAHDFWLEPSTFAPGVDEPVRIHLRIGERFAGESLARNGSLIEKFVLVGPSGERPVLGRDGMDPAGLVRLDAPGIWFVGYRSRPSAVVLAPEKFEQYLREEGLEHIIQERVARKESLTPVRERFSRSVKSLLRYGGDQAVQGYDRALGMTLEFVLDADPARAPGGRVPVRLLRDGRPLAGALVVAYRRDSNATVPGAASQGKATEDRNAGDNNEALRARTDKDGRIVLPVSSGVWLLKSVYMERATAGSGADWESVWSALTFKVG
jgi:uncharacterized GH25 family protein